MSNLISAFLAVFLIGMAANSFSQERNDSLFPAASKFGLYTETILPFNLNGLKDTLKPKDKKTTNDSLKVEEELNDAYHKDSVKERTNTVRYLKLMVKDVYGDLSFSYSKKSEDTGRSVWSGLLAFRSEVRIYRVGKYRWGNIVFNGMYNTTKNNIRGEVYLRALLDKYVSVSAGFKEEPTAIIKGRFTSPERHVPVPISTLEYVGNNIYPGAELVIDRIFNWLQVSISAQMVENDAKVGTTLLVGKILKFGGTYKGKIWEASGRFSSKLCDVAVYNRKDSVLSLYTVWRPPIRTDFWGTLTYKHKTEEFTGQIGFYYNIKLPFLTQTSYTMVQLGAAYEHPKAFWLGFKVFFDKYRF